ncbi:2-amino-4-hydroxy-6-hydroxymethyldihydropteridine diphosphokinase [Parahaliea sp. F7430]|uniref:2-amino-4-hydroxy-6-hydroxymethyldihydropteridine pyrophosphokinase n=1 Tax=Sediminihaliea albiluteola TaxID=2758564 RepID=A0A7W2TW89_9GAMM|nr:2-amino-4-hydroxy-6-hydroxymethyldihydropteridine diphosphokinase [Sediminihaliea albiluteola]MBA6413093.1 2-amino-4-hydroxy-6-hydroxymethyldihydropteridine diphosphokinase [Sediminihaliea albiluteola]
MISCYISLGSNLENPEAQLQQAVSSIASIARSQVAASSAVYRSAPVGPGQQADYLNAVLALGTDLPPMDLLDALQSIENAQGRVREQRWGPRTLDLDILLYGKQIINEPRLTVPHPAMSERNFVLRPLADICNQDFALPCGDTLGKLLQNCHGGRLERTSIRLNIPPSQGVQLER